MKADYAGAGPQGSYYPDYIPFTPVEVCQHFAIYFLHRLSPSPRIEMKFNTQAKDRINGNDFIANTLRYPHHTIGPRRCHQQFKAFLSLQDPCIPEPSQEKYPNWKIRPLLVWMNYIFPMGWLLGLAISIDKMTIRFQG